MYADNKFYYKIEMQLTTYKHREGAIVQITGGGLSKQVVIGNIYSPPKILAENITDFINELTHILEHFDKHTHAFILAGDYNLLKIN